MNRLKNNVAKIVPGKRLEANSNLSEAVLSSIKSAKNQTYAKKLAQFLDADFISHKDFWEIVYKRKDGKVVTITPRFVCKYSSLKDVHGGYPLDFLHIDFGGFATR